MQALSELWSRCAKLDRLPTAGELAGAKALMARPAWRLDAAAGTAEHLTACPLSLNSIAKGYIIGRACEAAFDRARGVRGVLLNIGGDVRVVGNVARTVGVAPPVGDSETAKPIARVEVRDRSVATSGSSQRGFRVGGKWYSHIFDPRTGQPAGRVVGATVIAERAADANALATTLNVLPVEDGLRLAASIPGAECLIATADGQTRKSAGWSRYERAPTATAATATPVGTARDSKVDSRGSWGDAYELLVNFEINGSAANSRRYRRPYVAVWIEDKGGLTVRTLSLWLMSRQPGPRWHRELKRWYRDDQARRKSDDTDLIDTISRAHAPPGSILSPGTARTTTANRSGPAPTQSASRPRASTGHISSSERRSRSRRSRSPRTSREMSRSSLPRSSFAARARGTSPARPVRKSMNKNLGRIAASRHGLIAKIKKAARQFADFTAFESLRREELS